MADDDDNLQRNPQDWKTGDDPMTDAQRVYMDTLASQTGEPTPADHMTKAEAAEKIEDLRDKAGLDTENGQ